jgi:aldehyde dehydrogenase
MFLWKSVGDADDAFFDKAVEGAVFCFESREICTAPSRLLVHEAIYDKFIAKVIERTNAIKMGNPLDVTTDGAQASLVQKKEKLCLT